MSDAAASPLARAFAAVVALAALGAGLAMAGHHPLSPALAIAALLVATAAFAAHDRAALFVLPALLPWIGLAPWTGWIVFEEFDLLVLAAAAGGWLRRAAAARTPSERRADPVWGGWGAIAALTWTVWTASVAISAWRGVADAGGWAFDWFAGYREPLNALRLVKPTVAVLLLAPLWRGALRRDDVHAARALAVGLALGHAGAALACVWERAAFPGLTNFSTDYRTTALFWEMHVGGAALDGWLALTAPFVWQRLARARALWQVVLWAMVAALGVYAALTTFSRILLLAMPLAIGVAVVVGLYSVQPRDRRDVAPSSEGSSTQATIALALVAAIGIGAAAMNFATAGYRGMLALVGCLVLAPAAAAAAARLRGRERAAAAVIALLGAVAALASPAIAKGPYLIDAVLLGLAAAGFAVTRFQPSSDAGTARWPTIVGVGAWGAAIAAMVVVSRHWGGAGATAPALGAALALLVGGGLLLAVSHPPKQMPALRTQALFALAMVVGSATVGVVGGGSYLGSRLQTVGSDEDARWLHWRSSLQSLPDETSRWLGVGLGRYLDRLSMSPDAGRRAGDMRRVVVDGRPTVRVVNGAPPVDWGELLRLSQRIGPLVGPVIVSVEARGVAAPSLHVEICAKHLLYDETCRVAQPTFTVPNDRWQTLTIRLDGAPIGLPQAGLPRWTVLSLAAPGARERVEIRSVSVIDGQGRERVANGDFRDGLSHWFITSDRNHLPWHAKNIAVHLLFEQGLLGLVAMAGLLAGVAGVVVAARRHPLAAPIAGGVVGFLAVGAVDSLLDIPRVAAAFLLLLAIAPSLRAPAPAPAPAPIPGPMTWARRAAR